MQSYRYIPCLDPFFGDIGLSEMIYSLMRVRAPSDPGVVTMVGTLVR